MGVRAWESWGAGGITLRRKDLKKRYERGYGGKPVKGIWRGIWEHWENLGDYNPQ